MEIRFIVSTFYVRLTIETSQVSGNQAIVILSFSSQPIWDWKPFQSFYDWIFHISNFICSLYFVWIQKGFKHLHHRYIRFFKAIFSKTFGPQLEILNYIFILEDSSFRIGQTFTVLQNSQQQCTNTSLPCFFLFFFLSFS